MATVGNATFSADDPRTLAHFWLGVFGYPLLEWDEPLKSQLLAAGLSESDLSLRAPELYYQLQDPAGNEFCLQ